MDEAGLALLRSIEALAKEIRESQIRFEEKQSRDGHATTALAKLRGAANKRKAKERSKSRDNHATESRDSHVTEGTIGEISCSSEKQKQEINPLPPVTRSHVTRVFEHWQTTWAKPKAELTKDRERKIQARLRDGYAVERLCDAVSGSKLDPWEGRKDQCDLVQLLKPANVDKFAELWEAKQSVSKNGAPKLAPWEQRDLEERELMAKHGIGRSA